MGSRDKGATKNVVVTILKRGGIRAKAKSLKVREAREIDLDGDNIITRVYCSMIA